MAMASISIFAPLGSVGTSTVARAGGFSGKPVWLVQTKPRVSVCVCVFVSDTNRTTYATREPRDARD
jgi:ABC-type transport system involved in cytochrome c biogenesis permease subunit